MIKKFVNEEGDILSKVELNEIYTENVIIRGRKTHLLHSPGLLKFAREYFGCETL